MLRNEPPPGTQIRFTSQARKVAAYERGKLLKAIGYHNEQPSDLFEVEYQGQSLTVTRAEIEEA